MEGAREAEVLDWMLVKPTDAVVQRERRDLTLLLCPGPGPQPPRSFTLSGPAHLRG